MTPKRQRPRAGHGFASDMPGDRTVTKRNTSTKPHRNRNRVTSSKPAAVARRATQRDS